MVKQGYKQTELGVIPEDWCIREIGDFTNATAGGTPSTAHPEYWNGEILWMSSGELSKRRIYDVVGRITELGYSNSSTHMIPKNCVLIGLAGQGKTRGTVAINYVGLCTNQSIAAIFPSTEYKSEYLYQNLCSRYEELRELSSGAGGRGGLNIRIIKNFPCAFPPLDEQERIAEALSDMDELIFSLERLIAKKKAIKQGAMQELLTGKKRLHGYIGKWNVYRLGDISNIKTGDKNNEQKNDNGKYPFYVRSQQIEKIDSYSYDGEAILVPGEGNIGQIFHYINGKFDWHQRVYKISDFSDFIYGKYIFYQMVFGFGAHALKNTVKSTVDSLRLPIFENFEIFAPQTIREQIAIATILSDMDNEIEALEQKLAKTRQIKQGMMQQLLTGKIRLVEKGAITDITAEQNNLPKTKTGHNQHFDDAVMIAAIVNSFYTEKYPLGRKKVQKLLYLLRRKQEADTSEFKKKAAGPYADEIRYKGGEPIAKKNGYITATTTPKGTSFSKGKKIDEALSYVEKWKMQSAIDWLIANFKYVGVNDLELYATIDMAICDLRNEGIGISVDSVKELIRSNSEWKAKLNKSYFSDDDIARAINMSYKLYS